MDYVGRNHNVILNHVLRILFHFNIPFAFAATCDFENDKCTWKNTLNEDTFDWIIRQGNTPSRGTGPLTDHSKGNGDGNIFVIYMRKLS